MRVIEPGHVYKLDWLDGHAAGVAGASSRQGEFLEEDNLIFVKREGEGYPGNVGHHPGTNLQEVLRACINRVKYLDSQISDHCNDLTISALREALYWLERRAAERHGRVLPLSFSHDIELFATCGLCGHVGCVGACKGHKPTV